MPLLLRAARRGFESLRRARCYIGDIDGASTSLEGWILLPDEQITAVEVHLNGTALGLAEIRFRQDVAALYPRIPHAGWSGFQIGLEPGQLKAEDITRVAVVGYRGKRPIARAEMLLFRKELIPPAPLPPPELIEKVQGGRDAEAYRTLGFRYCRQFLDAIGRRRSWPSVRRLLDWGCGSGRVAAGFLAAHHVPEVFGCDTDAEAVAWCQAHLQPGHFTQSGPTPPLPFADATFDVVLSLAVFASFGPAAYEAWLPELGRVLAPGGLLLASVQGVFAATFELTPGSLRTLHAKGILDGGQRDTGQWRGYYLTPEYARQQWSKDFEILEHLEGEVNADQDLLVMRPVDSRCRRTTAGVGRGQKQ